MRNISITRSNQTDSHERIASRATFEQRMVVVREIAVATLLAASVPFSSVQLLADVQADLNAAKNDLFTGRVYLVDFPGSKTRNQVRNAYLNVQPDGTPLGSGKFGLLQSATDTAVRIRNDPLNAAAVTAAELELAQRIAWEAQEALLQGQVIAGNANLLKGLRVDWRCPQ